MVVEFPHGLVRLNIVLVAATLIVLTVRVQDRAASALPTAHTSDRRRS